MQRFHDLTAVLLLALAATAHADTPPRRTLGICRVDASPGFERARATLVRVASRRYTVLGPDELLLRVARDPAVRDSVARARRLLVEAELALADLDRPRATSAAERAVASLDVTAGRLHSPALVAQAQLALARANLLSPTDAAAAQAAVNAAVAADPELAADLRVVAPRVAAMIEAARARKLPAAVSTRRELRLIASAAGVDEIAHLSVEPAAPCDGPAARRASPRRSRPRTPGRAARVGARDHPGGLARRRPAPDAGGRRSRSRPCLAVAPPLVPALVVLDDR